MENQNTPLVSVVVPVYKVEKYIARCIESILAQTYRNLELILVDDGSPDQSGRICDEYAGIDCRVKVIHTPNHGVSCARNTGIDHAIGDYLMFVDSDDWVSPHYISSLLPTHGDDLVVGGYACITKDGESSVNAYQSHTIDKKHLKKDFSGYWTAGAVVHPWGNCYRLAIIETNQIRFDTSFSIAEDELFNLNYIFCCDVMRYTDASNYNYSCEVESSLMHRHHSNRTESGCAVVQAMERISGKDEHVLRWCEWQSVIAHHRKHKVLSPMAKECLMSSYRVKYFRESLPHIRKCGTLDQKVETYFMRYWLHPLYKPFYKLVVLLSRAKRAIARRQ